MLPKPELLQLLRCTLPSGPACCVPRSPAKADPGRRALAAVAQGYLRRDKYGDVFHHGIYALAELSLRITNPLRRHLWFLPVSAGQISSGAVPLHAGSKCPCRHPQEGKGIICRCSAGMLGLRDCISAVAWLDSAFAQQHASSRAAKSFWTRLALKARLRLP